MNKEYINRISKYFYHFITKIKIKKSKEDSRKLKELELALSKAEEEKEIAYNKYSKLLDKTIRITASITKIENKLYGIFKNNYIFFLENGYVKF